MAVRQRLVAGARENSGPSRNGEDRSITRPDLPCHVPCESLFSSRSGFHNYRGLLNNCIILLVLSNSRNVINNLVKYGILVNPLQFGYGAIHIHWSVCIFFLVSYTFPVVLLQVEKLAAKGSLSGRSLQTFYLCYFALLLLLPACYSYFAMVGPVYSSLALGWYTILWLKLISYAQVNSWCRNSKIRGATDAASGVKNSASGVKEPKPPVEESEALVRYPDNLSLRDMVYFLFAPTLCYELNFPRTKKRRWVFILRRVMESVFILNVNLAIMQQWIMPTALNSLEPFRDMDWAKMAERAFILALPNHLFWLLGFYLIFHSLLNLVGELLLFGDRQFYCDWWNAQNIRDFWRSWNIPVHRWATRHVYLPMKNQGYSSLTAQMAVFLLSAFFHEYLVSLPLQMIRPWAFVGMLSQIPLGILTAFPFARGQIGNVIVWTSIILGQPVAILMYLHDYYLLHWVGHPLPTTQSFTQ